MSFTIDRELHDAFKMVTASQGKRMGKVLEALIEQYVTKHQPEALPKKKGGR